MNLRFHFAIDGVVDGPVSQRLLDEGKTPDWFAQHMKTDLEELLRAEMTYESLTTNIQIAVEAEMYDPTKGVGHAEDTPNS